MQKTNVVCFGGGTGLPTLLSGLKNNPWLDVTAVVNMFDTGGSSGELRDRFGILPPGDVLKCMLGLSTLDEKLVRQILLTRIVNDGMPGHTGGNALLLGLEKMYGDYMHAIDAMGQMLSIKGKVVPVSLEPSNLVATYKDGSIHRGETSVDMGMKEGKIIVDLNLEPTVNASREAISAIEDADVICIGPGSFYTSVLPNFLPQGIKEAIKESEAHIIFIANLLTEGKGMTGTRAEDALQIVEDMIETSVSSVVVSSAPKNSQLLREYAMECKFPLTRRSHGDIRYIEADLWDGSIARHDSTKLGYLISSIISQSVRGKV